MGQQIHGSYAKRTNALRLMLIKRINKLTKEMSLRLFFFIKISHFIERNFSDKLRQADHAQLHLRLSRTKNSIPVTDRKKKRRASDRKSHQQSSRLSHCSIARLSSVAGRKAETFFTQSVVKGKINQNNLQNITK